MRSPQKIPTTNSIRLRLSLIAGVMLLVLLFSVYVGGRYIVVQMIHQTEAHMQTVGGDIQTPGSLAARASVALGWLTCFIAVVGIVFVIPIFWIHSKLILDPLDVLTRQIHEALAKPPRDMGVPPMKHGQDARATPARTGFCRIF
jgi:hypothetical protein